jgi:REP element-mobilizing transposase RayT
MSIPTPDPLPPTEAGRPHPHRGWHSRGYLPHFDSAEVVQCIVFGLHDTVPTEIVEKWRRALLFPTDGSSSPQRANALRAKIDRYEDAGHGECWLREPRIAAIVESALLHFDGVRHRLYEWCVMPNHVHALAGFDLGFPLNHVVRSWKGYTGHEANRILGRTGQFWAPDYYDRFIRDERHFQAARRYIRMNPVVPGLCATPEDWPWGSARRG